MIRITKTEAMYMSQKGFKWGSTLHTTHSRYHHYFITEDYKAMKILNDYRNSITNN